MSEIVCAKCGKPLKECGPVKVVITGSFREQNCDFVDYADSLNIYHLDCWNCKIK